MTKKSDTDCTGTIVELVELLIIPRKTVQNKQVRVSTRVHKRKPIKTGKGNLCTDGVFDFRAILTNDCFSSKVDIENNKLPR